MSGVEQVELPHAATGYRASVTDMGSGKRVPAANSIPLSGPRAPKTGADDPKPHSALLGGERVALPHYNLEVIMTHDLCGCHSGA